MEHRPRESPAAGQKRNEASKTLTPPRELFSSGRLFLPPPRSGETLYSWCAHYHVLSSNPTPHRTSRQLFNHRDAALKHDFPISLDQLIARTAGFLGTRQQVILDRTPVGAFFRFIDTNLRQEVCDVMGGNAHRVARLLGILAVDHGTPAPLKACSECVRETISKTRSSCWHTLDQLPGVYICPAHGTLLRIANSDAHRRARSDFVLPHMLDDFDWLGIPPLSRGPLNRLRALTDWSLALRTTSDSLPAPFDAAILRDTCHLQAKKRGWVAIDGSLQFKQIRQAIAAEYAGLYAVPGLEFLSGSELEHGGFVGLLLRQFDGVHHPLMHVALLAFLFDSPAQFFASYAEATQLSPSDRRVLLVSERQALSALLGDLIGKHGMSVNQAAKLTGITATRALRLLKEIGIETTRRPRIAGTALEPILVKRLESGDAPEQIASDLDIRRGFIKDYLASHPDLRQTHNAARFAQRRDEYRNRFRQILEDNPSLPIKRIRREACNGFEWLLRNDRPWLEQVLPGIWHR